MKFHKSISKSIVTTIILGIIFTAAFSNINTLVSADDIHKTVTQNNDHNASSGGNITTGTQADIDQGLLSLESVPNLNFGSNENGNTDSDSNLKLTTNSEDSDKTGNEGSNGNLLKVADYRNVNANNNSEGWTLTATLNPVSNADNTRYDQSTYSQSQQNGWKINMSNNQSMTYQANNYDRYSGGNKDTSNNSAPTIHNADLPSDGHSPQDIIGTSNNYYRGHGLTSINYNNNSTTLSTPYNVQPGKYTTSITWNLSANPDASDNQTT